MKHLGNLRSSDGARSKKKRIGRGEGSGKGGTATKGHKGAQSRSGYKKMRSFEGGQMPLVRRIPKFGFYNRNRVEYQIVNVGRLQELVDNNKIDPNAITFDSLLEIGVINNRRMPLKILGNGELSASLSVEAHRFTESAKEKIESVGGTVKLYE
jgi:large subunit ribosomal protein L15